jgi:hypothetical protein
MKSTPFSLSDSISKRTLRQLSRPSRGLRWRKPAPIRLNTLSDQGWASLSNRSFLIFRQVFIKEKPGVDLECPNRPEHLNRTDSRVFRKVRNRLLQIFLRRGDQSEPDIAGVIPSIIVCYAV